MKQVPLSHGFVATVDDDDFDAVSVFRWRVATISRKDGTKFHYAIRTINRRDGAQRIKTTQTMHQFLLPSNLMIDHADGDGLNNQRNNIRLATNSLNQANRKHLPLNGSSQYRGVTFHKNCNRWQASIKVNQKSIYLGVFINEIDAAHAYNEAALIHFGEFANLNEIGAAA